MTRKKATTRYFPMPDEVCAKYFVSLISEHKPGLAEAKFMLLFREGRWSSKQRETWATIKKASAETKALVRSAYDDKNGSFDDMPAPDFIIIVNYDVWNKFEANDKAREALLYHELCHVFKDEDKDGNPKYSLLGHDFEDFYSVIRLYGHWSEDARRMFDVMNDAGQTVIEFKRSDEAEEHDDLEAAAL